ncbi:carboxy-cis,cis-muconate cyclase [Malassezia yamatoensis]|uniref:Carboxy-cis,cis-muconate cyclase n=1 Tax=Malassezia yamatoensis TaxID=253288 RepID=A0AAJ6CIJ7_9BASI|nr:carboxy-cis,cis-muconate cyclase [Malassezia yamatoensis]
MTAPPLAVSVWGHGRSVPTLDPGCLYSLAVLQLGFGADHELYVIEPRSWPNPENVPSVYNAEKHAGQVLIGDAVASTPDGLRDYLRNRSSLDAPLRQAPLAAARAQAVQSMLDDALADLVLHTLFSLPTNFQKVTADCLAPIQRSILPSSLPRRLRASVGKRLSSPAINLWGLGGSWQRSDAQEARRWNLTAGLAEARDPTSQLPRQGVQSAYAADVQEQWERSRIAARARELFQTLITMMNSAPFLVGCQHPTSIDARMYSLLAPLLLGPSLPIALLPTLLREEFPELVAHTERMHTYLWGTNPTESWAFQRKECVYGPSNFSWQSLWQSFSPRNWFGSQNSSQPANLPPTLRYGRWAFYIWAIVGPLAYVALTGLVTIEYEDPDEQELDLDEISDQEREKLQDVDQETLAPGQEYANSAPAPTEMEDDGSLPSEPNSEIDPMEFLDEEWQVDDE